MSSDIKQIKKDLEAYRSLAAQLPALTSAIRDLESHCRYAIGNNWGLCRESKHSDSVKDQVEEILKNNHTPDVMRAQLSALYPLLRAAKDNYAKASKKLSAMKKALLEDEDSAFAGARSMLGEIRERIYEKCCAALRPFTNERSAASLAKETDLCKELEFRLTNISVIGCDPETNFSMLSSLLTEIEHNGALAK
jgi:hypothetical protein